MKNIVFFLFLSMTLLSCSSSAKLINPSKSSDTSYKIIKITKKNSWYIIYAERNDTVYKVVSKYDDSVLKNCKKVIEGKSYNLKLESKRDNVPVIGGVKLKPLNYLDVKSHAYDKDGMECYRYDEETEICTEPKSGIYDLFYATNIKGLCYVK